MKKLMLALCFAVLGIFGARSESYIYLLDNFPYGECDFVKINGDEIKLNKPCNGEKGGALKGLKDYSKALTKVVVTNPGKIVISRQMTWAEKPFHDEMTLDVQDGQSYYIELVTGSQNKLKLLDAKKGAKEVEKISKDKKWVVNPDQTYEN